MLQPIIREDFLYYIWKTKSFDLTQLLTQDQQPLEILQFGTQNFDAGPDFSNGRIEINGTTWVGNIEMHVYASDWERHCHDLDKSYDTVILHVVYEHDKEVYTSSEQKIPCLELKNRIHPTLLTNYARLIANNNWIPCERLISNVRPHTISFWLQRLVAERMSAKTERLKKLLIKTNFDWETTLYICLSRYMGARVNMDPFEHLAQSLPHLIIQKNRNDLFKIEALLYGQAGMLQADFEDAYFQELKKEYLFLAKKYNLNAIPVVSWKFSRMRPIGFPTIRIAQLAQIFFHNDRLFAKIAEEKHAREIRNIFKVHTSDYWTEHYRFGKLSNPKIKNIGDQLIDQLMVNVICPIVFLYGKYIADERYCERAIAHLESTKPEINKVTKGFKERGVRCQTASDSQALIQLKKGYCDEKRCVTCAIGNAIIKQNK